MKTKLPISSISYNTPQHLKKVLNQLVECGAADFYAFIWHKGEGDECGKKDHIHLYIEPTERIDTATINEMLIEQTDTLPLKAMPFRTSKFDDWCMYALHDKGYCKKKGLTKKYAYTYDCIATNDQDFLDFKYGSIDMIKITPYAVIEEALNAHVPFENLVRSGRVPIQHLKAYEYAYFQIAEARKHPTDDEFVFLEENLTFEEQMENCKTEHELDKLIMQNREFWEAYCHKKS